MAQVSVVAPPWRRLGYYRGVHGVQDPLHLLLHGLGSCCGQSSVVVVVVVDCGGAQQRCCWRGGGDGGGVSEMRRSGEVGGDGGGPRRQGWRYVVYWHHQGLWEEGRNVLVNK